MSSEHFASGGDQAYAVNAGPPTVQIDGFPFSPDSPIRRLAEPLSILIVPYIGALTVMDGRIAAAIKARSTVAEQTRGRYLNTARSATKLVFGTAEEARQTAEKLYVMHTGIKGKLDGVAYDANQAESQVWVLGSVFRGMEVANRRWAKPLTDNKREGLYADFRIFAEMFGINPAHMPANVGLFDQWWNDRVQSDDILQTQVSKEMTQTILRLQTKQIRPRILRLLHAVSVTSLEEPLQQKSGVVPTYEELRRARRFDAAAQHTYAHIPDRLRASMLPGALALRRITSRRT